MAQIVAVGSKNPVKIEAVRKGFQRIWPDVAWEVVSMSVESGVSAQPMSSEESIEGARNRAAAALKSVGAMYGVGIEGGLQEIDGSWFTCGWVAIVNERGQQGMGASINMEVPTKVMEGIRQGKELGEVVGALFGRKGVSKEEGYFGLMTKNGLDRTSAYVEGVITALVPFIRPGVFNY